MKLPLIPALDRAMDEGDKALLNEMLDRIQKLAILDDQNSIYDWIWEKLGEVGISDPPTTHLVANVEDLTDVLASASKEATDMDDDIGESSDNTPPTAKHTGRWTATSTYDVYVVDTLKNGGGDNPSGSNNDKGNGGPTKGGDGNSNNGGRFKCSDRGQGGDDDNDEDYNPDDDLERSLGPEDEDILNESLGDHNYDALRMRLVNTAKRIKNSSQRL